MIRLLIAGLMVLIAGNANAASNEFIYENCKKYADSGFNDNHESAPYCVMYFVGVRDALENICFEYQNYEGATPIEKSLLEYFAVGFEVSFSAAIQDYVNKMQKKPEDWKYGAGGDVMKSLQKIDSCKPK